MYQSLDSSDHHALSFGRVPLLTCIWMSGASGFGNQTTLTMLVELASFCSCIDFNVTDPLSSFEMNISSKYITPTFTDVFPDVFTEVSTDVFTDVFKDVFTDVFRDVFKAFTDVFQPDEKAFEVGST